MRDLVQFWGHHHLSRRVENFFQVSRRLCRALDVLDCLDPLCHLQTLLPGYRGHAALSQDGDGVGVFSEVNLVAHQDDRHARAVVADLGVPFLLDVVEGDGADDGETHEEYVGLRVGERSETIVVFLAGRVPEIEADELASHLHVLRVIVKSEREREREISEGMVVSTYFSSNYHLFYHLFVSAGERERERERDSHSRDVLPRKRVVDVGYHHARLAHCPVSHRHALHVL